MLCVRKRRAPAALAAASRLRAPSLRTRLVASKKDGLARVAPVGRLVSWLTTTSGSAARTAASSAGGVEGVADDRLRPRRSDRVRLAPPPGRPGHLVAGLGQLRARAAARSRRSLPLRRPSSPTPSRRSPLAPFTREPFRDPRQPGRSRGRRRRSAAVSVQPRASLLASPVSKAWLSAWKPYQRAPSQSSGARQEGRMTASATADAEGDDEGPDVADVVGVFDPVEADLVEEGARARAAPAGPEST